MTRRLSVRPEAERDIAAAYDWYEKREAGLGQRLMSQLDVALAAIEQTPELHPSSTAKFAAHSRGGSSSACFTS